MTILSGDIGGTKTLLGLFEPASDRPTRLDMRAFATADHRSLPSIIAGFLSDTSSDGVSIDRACFGVAGPVRGEVARLTNVAWRIDAREVAETCGIARVSLLNDLEAMAYAVPVLNGTELVTLQAGEPLLSGNMALIAAGTGLGEALLHNVDGRYIPSPSEGGHADFAPRNEREVELMHALTARFGRAQVEDVVSGRGLVNLHGVTHRGGKCPFGIDPEAPDAPASISAAALERRCDRCVEALEMFVEAYAAEAANLALRSVATAGVFVGGGIAPKILPALTDGRFLRVFQAKAPLSAMLARMPVRVILNAEAGLVGAAVYAATRSA
jgi:glucokinase